MKPSLVGRLMLAYAVVLAAVLVSSWWGQHSLVRGRACGAAPVGPQRPGTRPRRQAGDAGARQEPARGLPPLRRSGHAGRDPTTSRRVLRLVRRDGQLRADGHRARAARRHALRVVRVHRGRGSGRPATEGGPLGGGPPRVRHHVGRRRATARQRRGALPPRCRRHARATRVGRGGDRQRPHARPLADRARRRVLARSGLRAVALRGPADLPARPAARRRGRRPSDPGGRQRAGRARGTGERPARARAPAGGRAAAGREAVGAR